MKEILRKNLAVISLTLVVSLGLIHSYVLIRHEIKVKEYVELVKENIEPVEYDVIEEYRNKKRTTDLTMYKIVTATGVTKELNCKFRDISFVGKDKLRDRPDSLIRHKLIIYKSTNLSMPDNLKKISEQQKVCNDIYLIEFKRKETHTSTSKEEFFK